MNTVNKNLSTIQARMIVKMPTTPKPEIIPTPQKKLKRGTVIPSKKRKTQNKVAARKN